MQNGFGFPVQEISQENRPRGSRLPYKLARLGLVSFVVLSLIGLRPSSSSSAAGNVSLNASLGFTGVSANSAIKLSQVVGAGGRLNAYLISNNSEWVVYSAEQDTGAPNELFSVPIGGGTITKLNAPLVNGGTVRGYKISQDSRNVVYSADQETAGKIEFYSVPIGGGTVTKLNGDLVASLNTSIFQISADNSRVIYTAYDNATRGPDLFSVPIGGGTVTKLNTPAPAFGGVNDFQISRDSSYVVYQGDQETQGMYELYSVPVGGGTVTKLNVPLVNGGSVVWPQISPDSSLVTYLAVQDWNGGNDLYSVPIGGGSSVKLANMRSWDDSRIDADSSRVVYQGVQDFANYVIEIYSVPIRGGTVTKLNAPLAANGNVIRFQISTASGRVIYQARYDGTGGAELYSVPVGGGDVTKLNASLFNGGTVLTFLTSTDGRRVVYQATKEKNAGAELYSVPVGGGTATRINAPLVSDGTVLNFQITADSSRVTYRANQGMNEGAELFSVPIDGGAVTKLNAPLASNGSVDEFQVSPDSSRVVYGVTQETGAVVELYSAPMWTSSLTISKTVSTAVAMPGDILTYAVAVSALGGSASIAVTDTLPSGVSFTGVSNPDLAYDPSRRQLQFIGTIEPNQPLSYTYTARIEDQVAPGSVLQSEVIASAFGETYAAGAAVVIPQAATVPTLNLIYANGNNNLGSHMPALFQKAEAGAGNATMTTLFLVDGPENGDAYLYRLQPNQDLGEDCPTIYNPDCHGRYVINQSMWKWGESVSTSSSLSAFVAQAIAAYPARQVTLSLVGHGGGWSPDLRPGQPSFHDGKPTEDELGGLLWDETPESSLSTRELGEALRDAKSKTGRQIDLLYLDACLMAMTEVAYEVRDSVDYLLASESWSWTSFRYDLHLAVSGDLSAAEIGKRWIADEAQELRGDGVRPNYPFTYSLLDLRAMNEVLERENTLATALTSSLPDSRSMILNAFVHSDCFDGDQDYELLPADIDDYYCDLSSFAQRLAVEFGPQTPVYDAATALDATIWGRLRVTADQNPGRPWRHPEHLWSWQPLGGVSKYLPLGVDDWKRAYYNPTYVQSTADGGWDEFLATYWGSAPPPPPDACTSNCEPQGPDALSELYLPVLNK